MSLCMNHFTPRLANSSTRFLQSPKTLLPRATARRIRRLNAYSTAPLSRRVNVASSGLTGEAPSPSPSAPAPSTAAPPVNFQTTRTYLGELRISNFALIEYEEIKLSPGLNVITGESGSGKSVLIDALGQILGDPASADIVRPPAECAIVEAIFHVPFSDLEQIKTRLRDQMHISVPSFMEQYLTPSMTTTTYDNGANSNTTSRSMAVSLKREIYATPTGKFRSMCYINGIKANLYELKGLGQSLVEVSQQNASINLSNSDTQIRLLDSISGLRGMKRNFTSLYFRLSDARSELYKVNALADANERAALQELVDDVAALGVSYGEDELLRRQLRNLDARRDAAERCRLVSVGLTGDGSSSGGGSLVDAIYDTERNLRAVLAQQERLRAQALEEKEQGGAATSGRRAGATSSNNNDDDDDDDDEENDQGVLLEEALEALDTARASLDDAQRSVDKYLRRYRFSQAEYDEISNRLQDIERLVKQYKYQYKGKYGLNEVMQRAEEARKTLDAYYKAEGRRDELENEVVKQEKVAIKAALELSVARRTAAQHMQNAVCLILKDLAMPHARFEVKFKWKSADGAFKFYGKEPRRDILSISQHDLEESPLLLSPSLNNSLPTPGDYIADFGGLDTVQFMFASGPEEALLPLSYVASGGEAARLMLAIKAAPSYFDNSNCRSNSSNSRGNDSDRAGGEVVDDAHSSTSSCIGENVLPPVLVLDEIDSGVGARLGQQVGRILRRMTRSQGQGHGSRGAVGRGPAQVLCVSHLPQVAAHADRHVCVRKEASADGRILTIFDVLTEREERLEEVSSMLGLGVEEAAQLLAAVEEERENGDGGDGMQLNN